MPRRKSQKSIKKMLSNKSPRIQNPWISYSNYFYKQLRKENQKIKRTDAAKLASVAWKSMSAEQKYPWYHSSNLKKIEGLLNLSNVKLLESTYDNQFIIEDVSLMSMNQARKNNSTEEDHCLNSMIPSAASQPIKNKNEENFLSTYDNQFIIKDASLMSSNQVEMNNLMEDHYLNSVIPSVASQPIDEEKNENEETFSLLNLSNVEFEYTYDNVIDVSLMSMNQTRMNTLTEEVHCLNNMIPSVASQPIDESLEYTYDNQFIIENVSLMSMNQVEMNNLMEDHYLNSVIPSFASQPIDEKNEFPLLNLGLLESTYDNQFIIEDVPLMPMNQATMNNPMEEDHCLNGVIPSFVNQPIYERKNKIEEISPLHFTYDNQFIIEDVSLMSVASQPIYEEKNKDEVNDTDDVIGSKMFDFVN
ncbi:unnamed protein product [Rhizophagus irregularis]|nr:unnamed protein product [Rhizophagus irregularis]